MSALQAKTTVGETVAWPGTWTTDGVAVNLSGYALTAEVRKPTDPEFLEEVAATLGNQSSAPGTYTVDLSSLALPVGSYQVRLRITAPGGAVSRSSAIGLLVEEP